MAERNIVEQQAVATLNAATEVAEKKVIDLVVNKGEKMQTALRKCGLERYKQKGPYKKDYRRLYRETRTMIKGKETKVNAQKCEWFLFLSMPVVEV